jgi:hypothetical protein
MNWCEFLVGLISLDTDTAHGGVLGEQRTLYIFRLYDEDADGFLSRPEFEQLVAAIRSASGQSGAAAEVAAEAGAALAAALGDNVDEGRLSQKQFLAAVGRLKIRGTSKLLRHTLMGGGGRRAGQNEALPARGSPIATAVPSAWARGAGAPSGGAAALARTATQEEEERSLSGLQLALAVIEQVLLEPGWEPAPTGAPFGLLEPLELVTLLGAAVRLAGSAEEEPGAIARTHARTVISAVRL